MLEDQIKEIIVDILGVDEKDIVDRSTLPELGADSLDSAEIMSALEDEFDIEIADSDEAEMMTFGQVVALVRTRTKENA